MDFNEYQALIRTMDVFMDAYYNRDESPISDYEFDEMMRRLKAAEKEHPEWVTPASPSQKIGGVAQRKAGVKVTHNVPMLSIEDVFNHEDVTAWVEKVHEVHPDAAFSVETKIDGLSMTLRYEHRDDGKLHLVLAETRGDGLIGEDVTANAYVIPDVRQTLDAPWDSLELRGEVYMSHEDFERFNREQEKAGKKTAANPRNLAAGTLRQLNPSITRDRGLRMFIFNVQSGPDELTESHAAGLDKLAALGVPVVFHRLCHTGEEVLKAIDEIGEMRGDLTFDMDGAVAKLDHVAYRADFPAGAKYSSGHIAYKYPPEERIVVMDRILVDVGRTGKLTYTGEFHDALTGKAARLCGTSVSRATLHNRDYIADMHIGTGGKYKVYKSGEIIPRMNGCVAEPKHIFEPPDRCPICGSVLVKSEDGPDIYCISPSCPVQLTRTVSYFASLNAMNILGLGESLVDDLVKDGYLASYADIYKLKDQREKLIASGILGKEKNTDKLLKAIDDSKNNDPVRLLTGLGIRNVGRGTAKDLMQHFRSVQALSEASMEELTAVDEVGENVARDILDFFAVADNKKLLEELRAAGVNMTLPDRDPSAEPLSGLKIAVTGTLPTLGRREVTELIERNGGKCTGSVSKNTSFVVAGESAGSKLTRAQELGIRVITEAELLSMVKQ